MKSKKNSISVNFLLQSAYQLMTLIMPLITTPYISRILGPENTGVYSYTTVIANYFVILAALGIEAYGNRSIANAKNVGQEEVNRVFSEIFLMHFMVSLIAFAAYLLYVFCFATQYKTLLLLQSFLIVGALFDINWFFFGIEEFKLTVTRNVIVKFVTVASIFIFVRTVDDLWKYVLIMSLGTFISQSVVWVFLPRFVSFRKVRFKAALKHLKPLMVLFVAVIATTLYRLIDKTMIGWMCNMEALGCYEYADRLIRMPVTLITALGTVMLPRMSSLYAANEDVKAKEYINTTSQFVFFLSFAMAFGMAAIANEFVSAFLGRGYETTSLYVQVLTVSIPFMGWNNLIRTQVLMPKSKDFIYTRAVWIGAIVNILFNVIIIYFCGAIGAAIATDVSYFIVGIFQTYPLRKEYPIKKYLRYSIVPIVSGVIMFAIVRMLLYLMPDTIISLVVSALIGAAIYVIINIIYLWKSKNEMIVSFVKKFTSK